MAMNIKPIVIIKYMKKKITLELMFDNGIFKNGKILSFYDGDDICKANKTYDKYGEYYKGDDLKTNFVEMFTDHECSIYSVIDNKGKVFTIGDYAPSCSVDSVLIKITRFYIRYNEIVYDGVETKLRMGTI